MQGLNGVEMDFADMLTSGNISEPLFPGQLFLQRWSGTMMSKQSELKFGKCMQDHTRQQLLLRMGLCFSVF